MKLLRLIRSILRGFAVTAILVVVGLATVGALLWIEHRTAVRLPTPTGSLAVGRIIDIWTDDAPATPATVSQTKRELMVWIWYPAAVGSPSATDDYMPAPLRTAVERARGPLISNFLTRDLSKVHAHSLQGAEVSPHERSYPVVIMRAGASGGVVNYSSLAEDLASHGYVVVGFDVPYRTGLVVSSDGRVTRGTMENNPELCLGRLVQERERCANRLLSAWIADIAFVLDRLDRLNTSNSPGKFAGRLDMTRVGVFGHSFGGATALQFCHEDSRCKAGIDLDGAPHGSVIQTGLRQPFMFLLSDHSQEDDPESLQIKANIKAIYDRLPANARLQIAIRGSNHFTFTDDGAVLKSHAVRALLRLFGKLRIGGRRQLAVTAYCVHSFFDACLKGPRLSRLEIVSPLYPEIEVLR
jgi:predicted dienelactone hydrolase